MWRLCDSLRLWGPLHQHKRHAREALFLRSPWDWQNHYPRRAQLRSRTRLVQRKLASSVVSLAIGPATALAVMDSVELRAALPAHAFVVASPGIGRATAPAWTWVDHCQKVCRLRRLLLLPGLNALNAAGLGIGLVTALAQVDHCQKVCSLRLLLLLPGLNALNAAGLGIGPATALAGPLAGPLAGQLSGLKGCWSKEGAPASSAVRRDIGRHLARRPLGCELEVSASSAVGVAIGVVTVRGDELMFALMDEVGGGMLQPLASTCGAGVV